MKRTITQLLGLIIPNSYLKVFWSGGSIYQGPLKGVCLPILNCYGCPSAYVSCPIGAIQHFFVIKAFPFYVLGLLGLGGLAIGRWPCGWLCPFGFLQDILAKVNRKLKLPRVKKLPRVLTYFRYLILVGLVVIVPFLTLEPWFCKLCPQGSLEAGIPQVLLHSQLRPLIGILFWSKIVILGAFLILMLFIERIFCRMFCPLGAILGLFNKISVLQLAVDNDQCNLCNKCYIVCPMGVKMYQNPTDTNCIRCMKCTHLCDALSMTTLFKMQSQTQIKAPEPDVSS